ncbi:MAG: phosphate transport system regulatory protein PhoU, partial [Oscillospiraceae bacterium]|nr:phosphate transport system regulatory protein PhoU [Oscillospiraceae bacterium]
MRNKFDQQLETLHVELIKMGALCEDAISGTVSALEKNSEEIIQNVFHLETEIDQKERDIEALCMKLLLQQQPVASDLRVVSAAMKMISDMERIGDQAADIAEITRYVQLTELREIAPVDKMAKAAVRMVTNAIDSFIKRDLTLAG